MADYVLTGFKWGDAEPGTPVGKITWSFAQNPGDFAEFDQYITDPEYQTLVREAFGEWEQVAGIDFVEVADSRSVDIRLGWSAIDGPFGTIGLAGTLEYPSSSPGGFGEITEAEIMFDLAEDWFTGKVPNPQQPTFYLTALHEIGHALGLDHTTNPDTLMYAFQNDVSGLTAGDIAGVRALYNAFLATSDADNILGTPQDDVISALAGSDLLEGGAGNDVLDGGPGTDTAIYSGDQSSYTLTLSPTATTVTDRRADGNGTDSLIDMELIDFDSGAFAPFDLTMFGGQAALSQDDFGSFIELYIAYFNRAPDAVGLNFWGTAFANGTTLEEMATLFIDQPETVAAYPEGTSNTVFAETVFNNVLGRTPDQAGLDFWVGVLDAGDVTRDQFILEVLRGAKSELKPEEGQAFVDQQLADREFLTNKTDIGAYFSVHKGMSDVDNAAAAMALFDGTEASIDTAVTAIDGYYADAQDPETGEFLMQVVGVLDDPFAAG